VQSSFAGECPRCGFRVKTQVGHTFECPRCGLKMSRQNVAAMNIRRRYLKGKPRMWGFSRSKDPEETMMVELRAGGHPEWAEPNDMGPDEMAL